MGELIGKGSKGKTPSQINQQSAASGSSAKKTANEADEKGRGGFSQSKPLLDAHLTQAGNCPATDGVHRPKRGSAEYFREYRQRPHVKKKLRRLGRRPERKMLRSICFQTPEEREKLRVMRRRWHLRHISKIKEQRRAQLTTEEGQVKVTRYNREYKRNRVECRKFMQELFSDNPMDKERAIYALGERRYLEAAEIIVKMLDDDEAAIRLASLWALGRLGNPDYTPLIINAVLTADGRGDQHSLAEGLRALGKLRNKEALRTIKRFLNHPDQLIRESAERACWLSFLPKKEAETKSIPTFKERPLPEYAIRFIQRLRTNPQK